MDAEIADLRKLLKMNGKKLSPKASDSTTSLTTYVLKSHKTHIALNKSNHPGAVPTAGRGGGKHSEAEVWGFLLLSEECIHRKETA